MQQPAMLAARAIKVIPPLNAHSAGAAWTMAGSSIKSLAQMLVAPTFAAEQGRTAG
jgi:hypothetical protein